MEPAKIYQILAEVTDPEIPVLNILDLGIVRNVQIEQDRVLVTITRNFAPTELLRHHGSLSSIFIRCHVRNRMKFPVLSAIPIILLSQVSSDQQPAKRSTIVTTASSRLSCSNAINRKL